MLAYVLLSTKGAYFGVCIFLSTKGAYYGAKKQAKDRRQDRSAAKIEAFGEIERQKNQHKRCEQQRYKY
jgi:hypothetical protein